MNKDKRIIEKQKELIDVLQAYATHVVIMWNKDLEDDESKNLKLRLWKKTKDLKSELSALESEPEQSEDYVLVDDGSVMGQKILKSEYDAQFKKPTKELFEKVYIRDEKDLPEEDGEYFCHNKKYGIGSTHYYAVNLARKYTWQTDIDWYLKPLK